MGERLSCDSHRAIEHRVGGSWRESLCTVGSRQSREYIRPNLHSKSDQQGKLCRNCSLIRNRLCSIRFYGLVVFVPTIDYMSPFITKAGHIQINNRCSNCIVPLRLPNANSQLPTEFHSKRIEFLVLYPKGSYLE